MVRRTTPLNGAACWLKELQLQCSSLLAFIYPSGLVPGNTDVATATAAGPDPGTGDTGDRVPGAMSERREEATRGLQDTARGSHLHIACRSICHGDQES